MNHNKLMKKSILSIALLSLLAQARADPTSPGRMVAILREKLPPNVQNFSEQVVRLKSSSQRKRLVDLMLPYIVLSDLAKARNANALVTMPYVANLCPQNQRRSLEERRVTIGILDTETLCRMTRPARELLDLSGRHIEGFREDIPTSDSVKYYALYEDMGVLARIYLDTAMNQNNPAFALPEFDEEVLPTLIACPNPNDQETPLKHSDGSINPGYFERWYENIHDVYNMSQGNLLLLSWLFRDNDRSRQISENVEFTSIKPVIENFSKRCDSPEIQSNIRQCFPIGREE
jgi:hypothetical protein